MKALFISDQTLPFLSDPVDHLNTSCLTILDVLDHLCELRENYDALFILAEPVFRGVSRQDHGGIALLKHIRLTPELAPLNRKPIVLLHWFDIGYYINKDRENLFLFAPGIYCRRLPMEDIQIEILKGLAEGEYFPEYIFGSERDEAMNDHTFRNELAIEQFKGQFKQQRLLVLDKDLWYKKIFYRLYHRSSINLYADSPSFSFPVSILLADDLGVKWKESLSIVFPKAEVSTCISSGEIIKILNQIKEVKGNIRAKISKLTSERFTIYSKVEDFKSEITKLSNDRRRHSNEIDTFEKELSLICKEKEQIITRFKELQPKLLETGGLMAILMDDEPYNNINDRNRQEGNALVDLMNKRSALDRSYSATNEKVEKLKATNEWYKNRIEELTVDLNQVTSRLAQVNKEISSSYSTLFNTPFDLILLDIYDVGQSSETSLSDTAGAVALRELQEIDNNIPTILFSASTRNLDSILAPISFVYGRFIKGITPVYELTQMIESIYDKRDYVKLLIIIEQISLFETFIGRKYTQNDRSDFIIYRINDINKEKIRNELEVIKKCLISLTMKPHPTITFSDQYNRILTSFAIIQERRLQYDTSNLNNSFWHHSNTENNRIGSEECTLRSDRNNKVHNPSGESSLGQLIAYGMLTFRRLIIGD